MNIDKDPFSRMEIIAGNIVTQAVDAIVNAANSTLLGGGGVDGAIHHAAGPELLEECRTLGGCPAGEARITKGYRLPARHVIHTVGPVYRDGLHGEPELLAAAYRASLALAEANRCASIAFPAISTGVYGYPKPEAAAIAIRATAAWLKDHAMPERVVFILFGPRDLEIFKEVFERLKSG